MEEITLIVSAISAGAAAIIKPTVDIVVKDAYEKVKSIITKKYGVSVNSLESKPDSKAKRESLSEDLSETDISKDKELLDKVSELLSLIEKHDPKTAQVVGIDIKGVTAAYLKAQKVTSTGNGVIVENSNFTGGIEFGEIDAGNSKQNPQ